LSFDPVDLPMHHREFSGACLRLSGPPPQMAKNECEVVQTQLKPM
jgi:hypothetical protein